MANVYDVVGVSLDPRRLVLGVSPFHVLGLGLVSHCLGMDFLELGDLGEQHVKESEHGEDLHHNRSSPKIANLSSGLSGAVLAKRLRKTRIS